MPLIDPKPCHFRNVGIKMETSDHSVGEGLAPPGREKRQFILFLDKKLYWIPEENLCQTRRSPQSTAEHNGDIWSRASTQYGANFAGKT